MYLIIAFEITNFYFNRMVAVGSEVINFRQKAKLCSQPKFFKSIIFDELRLITGSTCFYFLSPLIQCRAEQVTAKFCLRVAADETENNYLIFKYFRWNFFLIFFRYFS